MLSVFFSKANTASAVAGLVWFLFYIAHSFTIGIYDSLGLYAKMLLSLLSNTAMAFGFQIIVRLESTSEGLQWSNFWRPVSVDDNISVGLVTVMLLVCTVVYLLIALYVEQVFPGQYGVPQVYLLLSTDPPVSIVLKHCDSTALVLSIHKDFLVWSIKDLRSFGLNFDEWESRSL